MKAGIGAVGGQTVLAAAGEVVAEVVAEVAAEAVVVV